MAAPDVSSRDLKELENLLERKGESLREHQVEGLRELWKWHEEGRGGIVADEMGLGKTCTSVVHLWRLRRDGQGPFMVACPLSVVNHWKKEIERFSCGELEAICFMGIKEERRELLGSIDDELLNNQVFVIPYHLFTNEQEDLAPLLRNTKFSLIVADEAHTLKNWKAQITERMRTQLEGCTFLLLTGTPIQNDVGELYSLLSFCAPDKFPIDDLKEFMQKYKNKAKLDALRDILKKYSIRRKKEIVCDGLPSMQQVIFYHGMTKKQKKLYIDILVKNRESIMVKQDFSLANQLMHLRKAVVHPYLFPGQEPEPFTEGEHIVTASEKMKVLDALLSYLSRNSHRCLIFSQFTSLLDIVQDYLNMRGRSYERLDGSARAEERFESINSFQKADVDIFLLSTKAGGVGLTLTAADTVIFLDSDWNPQNDIQAMARCHRIGQTKPVRVIRLIGRYTVEQLMNVRAMAKLKLTDQLTEEENAKPTAADVSKMLEYGLASLRNEEEEDEKVTDAHFERVIGRTNESGEWVEVEEKEDKENSPSNTMEEDDNDVDEKDFFYFEGVRYRSSEKDRVAMAEIMGEKGSKMAEVKVWSKEELELMEKEKDERRERRKIMAEERKMKKWREAGYTSLNLPLPEGDEEMEGEDEEEGEEIKFVTGDLMRPKGEGTAVIVHVVDDSGSFGSGGVFSALDGLSPSIREAYEYAGDMGDLTMGDAHLITVKRGKGKEEEGEEEERSVEVVLIVAQKKTKRNELNLSALSKGLRRVGERVREGREKRGETVSVNAARMNNNITNVKWYAVEKTLKKELALHGIPLFVYYRPRRDRGGRGRFDKRSKSREGEEDEIIVLSPDRKEPAKKKRRVVIEGDEEDDQPGCSSWMDKKRNEKEKMEVENEREEEEEKEEMEEEEEEIPKNQRTFILGVFTGCVFYLAEGVTNLRSRIESQGGEVTVTLLDLYDVTHAIIPDGASEKEKTAIGLLPVGALIKTPQYIDECIAAKKLL
ncbi:hypothetical protein PFISCL1PPCAC_19523 [Pristionchus fissidentatus]|uniref:Helicase n=1 Tax=Pristionchus fissidentatus TaxID=1538716 RepID=A0AAV5W8Q9_9BILA|nr:hypothetical protein PFISCL1PPCAC_19523 [Pristionchus fissidentatus]